MTAPDPNPPGGSLPLTRGRGRSAAWIRDHLDAVYRYACRRVAREDAEDVTQQAFLALFRAEKEGRAPEDAGAYLLGVARRRVADVHRRRARGFVPVRLPEGWEGYANTPLSDDVLQQEELVALVHIVLGLLPAAARELLRERYREGLSTKEIAQRRDLTEKAVEMRLRRARAAFEERFLAVGGDWTIFEPEAGS